MASAGQSEIAIAAEDKMVTSAHVLDPFKMELELLKMKEIEND